MVTTGLGPRRSAVLRLLVVAVALAGALIGGLGGAAPASAHAALTGSTPVQGSVVDHAPEQVTLTFSEGVAMGDNSIRVLDPRGKRVDRGKLLNLSSGNVVKYGAGLPPGLGNGTYTVTWQAVSADSHPVSGAFTFSVGAPSKATAPVPQQKAGGGLVGALYGVARYLAYAGFVLLVGGAAFVVACRPAAALVRSVQRLVVQGWALLAGTTVAMLLLRTPYTGSGDLADVFDLAGLQQVLVTKPGAALVSRLLLLAAAALFVAVLFGTFARLHEPASQEPTPGEGPATGEEPVPGEERTAGQPAAGSAPGKTERADSGEEGTDAAGQPAVEAADLARQRRDLTFGLAFGGVIVAAGLAATWALAEHASTGLQTAVAMPVDVLHLLAVAAWLGGLAALVVSLYWGPPVERRAVRRFSRIAFGSVLVLVATGVYQSWRQVGSWRALTDTTYGWLLLLKVGLVVVLVGIAWVSRRWTGRLTEVRGAEEDVAEEDEEAEKDREAEEDREAEKAAVGALAATDAVTASASPTASAPPSSDRTPDRTPDGTPDESPDPARAAQLARQQAALRTARTKRQRDADPERLALRRSVLAEASVAVVLLVVTTVLTATEPARTEEAVKARSGGQSIASSGPQVLKIPFDTGGPGGKGTARLDLDPGRSGSANALRLRITDPSGKAVDVPEVKVSFTQKAKKIGPLPIAPKHLGKGQWRADGVQLPVPGQWQLSLLVRTSDIDQVTEIKNVKIG
ncbi:MULTISPECIES: copper resistance protein CopC [unclassified Streptomyces]|uniref:copper resistance CopC/CopD family protein n=1 Tax=unclassified Streptomyces TaxID=2593676 RepID=UPI0008844572|nr:MULTISPECIES: copper resistance protein CopC [unclassified Streptomyces]PBC83777.1 copper transport protein [Streptomyces sp. 2321.6]SDR38837.1 copper transport protein [Streptomyces sp. KS_16]SED07666.1 copper transport protein [Streptomyces sp. 2133.1]SNC69856.1 copper transport protein [Streptomyces sp. 2114.4]